MRQQGVTRSAVHEKLQGSASLRSAYGSFDISDSHATSRVYLALEKRVWPCARKRNSDHNCQNITLANFDRLDEKDETPAKAHSHTKDCGVGIRFGFAADADRRPRMRLKPPRELVAFGGFCVIYQNPGGFLTQRESLEYRDLKGNRLSWPNEQKRKE
jgi:hypothetical protein